MRAKEDQIKTLLNITSAEKDFEVPQTEEDDLNWMSAWDDVSGKELKADGVKRARALEMEYVNMKKVWRKTSRAEAARQGCKFIGTRWVDVDKGDDKSPDYRSRLVAKEFNTGQEEGLYASTPPLEALR